MSVTCHRQKGGTKLPTYSFYTDLPFPGLEQEEAGWYQVPCDTSHLSNVCHMTQAEMWH